MTEFTLKNRPTRKPTHPGAALHDVLEDMELSVSAFARGIHLSRQQLHKILSEKAPITPECAVKIGRFLGNGPGIWSRMQLSYDLWQAEQSIDEVIEPYHLA